MMALWFRACFSYSPCFPLFLVDLLSFEFLWPYTFPLLFLYFLVFLYFVFSWIFICLFSVGSFSGVFLLPSHSWACCVFDLSRFFRLVRRGSKVRLSGFRLYCLLTSWVQVVLLLCVSAMILLLAPVPGRLGMFPQTAPLLPSGSSCRGVPHPEPVDQHCSDPTPARTIRHPPVQPISSLGPTQRPPHAPAQFWLKKASSVGAVYGNDSSSINITDFSVTDGIDHEHKQEQRSKDTESIGRCGQQTSWASRSSAGQYERSRSTPPRQPTPDRRARTAYQTNAASTGDATDPGRSRVIRS